MYIHTTHYIKASYQKKTVFLASNDGICLLKIVTLSNQDIFVPPYYLFYMVF